MSSLHNIDPLDESLRLIYLEQLKNMNDEQSQSELLKIISVGSADLPATKKEQMLSKLLSVMQSVSFGSILEQAMQQTAIDENVLSKKTGLSVSAIHQLRMDSVYPNNIPIRLLKELIVQLQLSFVSVKSALLATVEQLKKQAVLDKIGNSTFSPAFRKGYEKSKHDAARQNNPSDGKELFENEAALNKYLNRLEELMNE